MNLLTASVSGENISEKKMKKKTAARHGLSFTRIMGGHKKRLAIIRSEKACLMENNRKLRSDKISEVVKEKVYNWWVGPQCSRPTGNKVDVKRQRIGYKTYLSHPIHFLQKTQTETFNEFKAKNPEIKISQRVFERLKPFFIRPMRTKDRNTCCCRKHVECRLLYNKCMSFLRTNGKSEHTYERLGNLVAATMCPRPANSEYHRPECINRKCNKCGVSKVWMFAEENMPTSGVQTTWERYEYVTFNVKGVQRRKLALVKKSTDPKSMFAYFREQIHTFAAHQYSANWQLDQLSALKQCLPINTCMVIHDFSENYRCIEKEELQSTYFSKTEVSIHVSVLYRHAVAEYDMMDEFATVAELFFTISPDCNHDHYFVSKVQEEIKTHLDHIGYQTNRMIEFTDGCSSQYKSKTCMGVSSLVCERLGYKSFQRNYFETSHAKGPQDAAGGLLKRQLDLAVMKGNTIQSAKDVYTFACENLAEPKSGIYLRRHFRYIQDIDRSVVYSFKSVPQNRKVHQLSSTNPGMISIREQSCYKCDNCIAGEEPCKNLHMTGDIRVLDLRQSTERETDGGDTTEMVGNEESITDIISEGDTIAVVADDEVDDYYLLKVKNPPQTLTKKFDDDWGNTFPANANIVTGEYLQKTTQQNGYRIVKSKTSAVYTSVVCYIVNANYCKSGTLILPEEEHIDILSAVSRLRDDFF